MENQKTSSAAETPAVRLPEAGSLMLSSSPHLRTRLSTSKIMAQVMMCLLPAVCMAVYHYGWNALRVILLCMVFCGGWEMLWCKVARQPQTIRDLSALLTGLIILGEKPTAREAVGCVLMFSAVILAQLSPVISSIRRSGRSHR